MKLIFRNIYLLFLVGIFSLATSCEVDVVNDPNNPSLGSVLNDASIAELQVLVTGLEARHREYYGSTTQMFGSFGREVWAYFGSDPRFLSHWLGVGISETYPDFFASAGSYVNPYLAVKQANVLIQSAGNSSAVTTQQAAGITGFAKTIKGFQLTIPLLQQWNNGIRVDVEDPLNPGPRLGIDDPQAAFAAILAVLDDGYSDLNSAGGSFPFALTGGWAGFDTPGSMAQVNRAIAARVALYAEDWSTAETNLGQSFMDMAGDLNEGPAHVFGEAPDINNPLFYPFDRSTSTILICHPSWVEDALPGDGRLAKVAERVDNPVTNPGLRDVNDELIPGVYQDARWSSNTAEAKFIRNEELILISAEVDARLGKTADAIAAINIIRNAWGVGDYTGGDSLDELIEEILFQRRYSLWAEGGHRWVDLRRTGKLDADHVDLRDQGVLFEQVSRRTTEINWDEG